MSTLPRLLMPPLMVSSGWLPVAKDWFLGLNVVDPAFSVPPLFVALPYEPKVPVPLLPPVRSDPRFNPPLIVTEPPAASENAALELMPKLPVTLTTPPLFTKTFAPPPGLFIKIPALLKPAALTFNTPRLAKLPKLAAAIGTL